MSGWRFSRSTGNNVSGHYKRYILKLISAQVVVEVEVGVELGNIKERKTNLKNANMQANEKMTETEIIC